VLYIGLLAEAKQYQDAPIKFTKTMAEKYGIKADTLYRRVKELNEAGFLKVKSGRTTRTASTYYLSDDWRTKPL